MQDQWTDRLSDYLDDELTGIERAALDAHLRECEACASTLDDLRRVVDEARMLSTRAPERDLWPSIAARIQTTPQTRPWWSALWSPAVDRQFAFSLPQLAAAALVLMLLGGGTTWLMRQRSLDAGGSSTADAPQAPQGPTAPASELTLANFADPQFDAAVADLQRALDQGRGRLDPRTIEILEKNLTIIDGAIAQARQALAADPANTYLNSYLADARRRKLELLRQATSLPDLAS